MVAKSKSFSSNSPNKKVLSFSTPQGQCNSASSVSIGKVPSSLKSVSCSVLGNKYLFNDKHQTANKIAANEFQLAKRINKLDFWINKFQKNKGLKRKSSNSKKVRFWRLGNLPKNQTKANIEIGKAFNVSSRANEKLQSLRKLTQSQELLNSPLGLKPILSNFVGKAYHPSSMYVVEIRAVFLKIGDIDTLNEKFYAEAFIEAKWIDPSLDYSSLSPLKYNPVTHWNPKIYVVNSLGEMKQQVWYNQYSIKEYNEKQSSDSSPPTASPGYLSIDLGATKCDSFMRDAATSGSVISERRRISGQFWQTLDLKHFPRDLQSLTVSLSTPKQENEIKLIHCQDKTSLVNVKCFVASHEWSLYSHVQAREYLRDGVFCDEAYPAIDLTISASRRPGFYYWNAFFLIFLITLFSLTTFSIKCHQNYSRIQITCTLLLTSVSFKWVINRYLPTVSYLTSLDKYSITSMILICLQGLWHSIIGSYIDPSIQQCVQNVYADLDQRAFYTFVALHALVQTVFGVWFARQACQKRARLTQLEAEYANEMSSKRSTRLKSIFYGAPNGQ